MSAAPHLPTTRGRIEPYGPELTASEPTPHENGAGFDLESIVAPAGWITYGLQVTVFAEAEGADAAACTARANIGDVSPEFQADFENLFLADPSESVLPFTWIIDWVEE